MDKMVEALQPLKADLTAKRDAAQVELTELHTQRDVILESMRPLEEQLRNVNALIRSAEEAHNVRDVGNQLAEIARVESNHRGSLRNG